MRNEPTTIDWVLHITRRHTPTEDWDKRNSLEHYFSVYADEQLIKTAPLLRKEVIRLRNGIRSILSDYDITELIRDVPEDEWNFEQQALVLLKELIE
jgi:hypothetical protein